MTNFEALCKGLQIVAGNHNFQANVEDWEEEREICVFGGCNVPLISDVRMLCDDVKFPKGNIETNEYGIDLYLTEKWLEGKGAKEYKPNALYSFWKRENQTL